VSDFDFEPASGLPGKLPPGETLLWQGSPDWRSLARGVFHIPLIAAYLGIILALQLVNAIYDRQPFTEAALGSLLIIGLTAACCGILGVLAFATARTTIYSITSERLVMRYGIALPMTLNIPFSKVDTAAAKIRAGGHGDISLKLLKGEKISYAMLWPHARPWRVSQPEPMLRGVPNGAEISAILARALAAAASRPSARAESVPPPATVRQLRPAPSAPRNAPAMQGVAKTA